MIVQSHAASRRVASTHSAERERFVWTEMLLLLRFPMRDGTWMHLRQVAWDQWIAVREADRHVSGHVRRNNGMFRWETVDDRGSAYSLTEAGQAITDPS
ncbi:hypothetical protein [Bifidobacterium sp. SO1]|uniref:hypothetical protein n=1 Tax=Bifidobacterium sp. SO1 TaxID=2809029 RepID=UPI001BDD8B57|nr:hypothetical protein [Bifidobacterium sp. SO1]MBT1161787.1 hypothetical protein [Bifidobacterium sp. SO1]